MSTDERSGGVERRLVTIGISHYCEKARWALDRAGLAYTEVPCAPGVHVAFVRRAGGRRSTPLLVDDGRVIGDSTDILDHLQAHPAARWRPWPVGAEGVEARALEGRFDDEVGPHVRRLAYHHLLRDPRLTVEVVRSRTSGRQAAGFALAFPVLRALMRRSMRIDDAGAARSAAKLEAVFAWVDDRLADGRRYLVGDHFSAADLTFASLAAVAVLHPRYLPTPLERLPAPLRELVEQTRARPSGRFVWRMYEEERAAPRSTGAPLTDTP